MLCGGLSESTSLTLTWNASSLALDRASGRIIVGVTIVTKLCWVETGLVVATGTGTAVLFQDEFVVQFRTRLANLYSRYQVAPILPPFPDPCLDF
jgi:hypothetical protein